MQDALHLASDVQRHPDGVFAVRLNGARCMQLFLNVICLLHKLTLTTPFHSSPLWSRAVYALFGQDRRVAFAMISLLTAEVGSMPGIIHMTIPTAAGNMCMNPITSRDIALFG